MSVNSSGDVSVRKTVKLYMNGGFPRSESGRTYPVKNKKGEVLAEVCQSSRKDLRNAIEIANQKKKKWFDSSAMLRSQILYRAAEMLQGRRDEFASLLVEINGSELKKATLEVEDAIDQLVYFAGFSDKYNQVASSLNPVSGPFHNFTSYEAMGTVVYVENQEEINLGVLLGNMAGILCSGNALIVLLENDAGLFVSLLGEVFQTSDLPPGTLALLSCQSGELLEPLASHRGVNCISGSSFEKKDLVTLMEKGASNLKRIHGSLPRNGLQKILAFTEAKTVWHTVGS